MYLFGIKDLKSDEIISYFVERNTHTALRGWSTLVNDGQSVMSKYPDDFALVLISDVDAILKAFAPAQVATGVDVVRGANPVIASTSNE